MKVREKILSLATKITVESHSGLHIKPTDPEYRILEPVVTDEMAEVALALKLRKWQTLEETAKKCKKSPEQTRRLLDDLAMAGVIELETLDGTERFCLPIWVPGIMERMVANVQQVEKYPVIAECFEEYTRIRTPIMAANLPIGMGVMRVIPVEGALMNNSRTATIEEISHYIENARLISVSDCFCRMTRRLMNEGCGHLEKDMCIMLDKNAEFYIKTGRGRQITKEEAYDVLRRAEENGLVHELNDTDGPGKATAICNCCECSCLSLRIARLYNAPDMIRSNYTARVDKEKCVACGKCVESCNMNALRLGQKLCSSKPLSSATTGRSYKSFFGKESWNEDFRTNREDVMPEGTSPCKTNCPAHIAVQGYIQLAAQGRYDDALKLIKSENPFPAVCGRICNRRCEDACTRGGIDSPVAIDDIKKFIAQMELSAENRYIPKLQNQLEKPFTNKIAVIGAGPAGLSCAYYLAVKGYPVTVFEKSHVLGGMLAMGIPSFRLEKDVVNAEIEVLHALGVQFKTGVEVGRDVTLEKLRQEGFEAFYAAIGAQGGRALGIPGEEAQGVYAGVEFLRGVNLGKGADLKGKTIVIGGGNVAVDVARTAARIGSEDVSLYCLESRAEMPASADELIETEAEGINICNSWGPVSILSEDGRVKAVTFKKCLSVFSSDGRFSPCFDESSTITVEADNVLVCVGQTVEWGELLKNTNVKLNANRTAKANGETYQTYEPDIFVGGDAFTGPRFAIDAIAAGKEAAISIHRFVQPGQSLILGRDKRNYRELDKDAAIIESYDSTPRQKPDTIGLQDAFRDNRGTLTEEQVKKEASRCLGCGATEVDEYMCVGCGICTTKCMFNAISLVKTYNADSGTWEQLTPSVAANAVKRTFKIAAGVFSGK